MTMNDSLCSGLVTVASRVVVSVEVLIGMKPRWYSLISISSLTSRGSA